MNKFMLGFLSVAVAMSLNAAVLATVDGKDVTDADVAPLLQGIGVANVNELPADVKKQAIDKAIELKLLTQKAIDNGIEGTDVYKKELEAVKTALALRVYQTEEFKKITVSDAEIKEFYDKNKKEFTRPASVEANHILVKTEKEAADIIKELKSLKGEALAAKFTELAKAKSIEPGAAASGGQIGWFSKEHMVKPFSDAAFAMKDGTASEKPVKTEFGYHVIYKKDSKAAGPVELDEAKSYIDSVVKQEKFKKQILDEAQALFKKAKIEYK